MESAQQALGQSVHTEHHTLTFGLICLALGLLPVFYFFGRIELLTPYDLLLVGIGISVMSFNVIFLPRHNLYKRLSALTRAAAILLVLLLAGTLLGPHGPALAQDRLPWIVSLVAIAPIYFHAYQLRPHADRLTWFFSMGATAVFCLHFVFVEDSGLTASAVWLGIVLSVGPLHTRVLLQLQVGIQGAMRGELNKKLKTLEREREALKALLEARQDRGIT